MPLEVINHAKKISSNFIWLKLNFVQETTKIPFESHFVGLRGNVCTACIARWKDCGQLPIRHDWTVFAVTYGWHIISGNLSKSVFFAGGGSLSNGRGRRLPTTVGVRKLKWLPFRVVSKYPQCIVWFCHKARMWWMNKQTELRLSRLH